MDATITAIVSTNLVAIKKIMTTTNTRTMTRALSYRVFHEKFIVAERVKIFQDFIKKNCLHYLFGL